MNDLELTQSKHQFGPESLIDERAKRAAEDSKNRAGEETNEYAEAAKKYVGDAAHRVQEQGARLKEQLRSATQKTNEYAHENPWPVIAIAAAVGACVALLISSSRRRE